MAKTCKFESKQKYVSYDSGATWNALDEYEVGELIEYNSPDCGASINYQWELAGYLCDGSDKYEKLVYQVSYDGGATWYNVTPSQFKKGNLIESNSKECDNAYEGHYEISGRTNYDPVKIVKCRGNNTILTYDDINIPPTVAYRVTYRYNLKTAKISDCVVGIDDRTFSGRTTFDSVTLPNSITSIGNNAFSYCGIQNINLNNSITSIGSSAFAGCNKLRTINIPNRITSIADHLFYGCSSLNNIIIPNTVKTVGSSAFYGCTNLKNITINEGLETIGNNAFTCIYSDANLIFPSTLKKIGSNTNDYCGSYGAEPNQSYTLKSILPPDVDVTDLSNYSGVTSFKGAREINVPCDSYILYKNNMFYSNWKNIIYPYGECQGTSANYAIRFDYGNGDTFDVPSISNNMEIYPTIAKGYISGQCSVEIGECVSSISADAFKGASALTAINVNLVTPPTLGKNALDDTNDCPIYIPCDRIDDYFNAGWSQYVNRLQCDIPNIYRLILSTSASTTAKKCNVSINTISSGDTSIFHNSSTLFSAQIGDCVTSIGDYAFGYCYGLTSCTISSAITSIGVSAFTHCYRLTSIDIPNSVTSIGKEAFQSCSGLTSIDIPNSVTSIGNYAFASCSGLTSCKIGSGVTSIGSSVFDFCSSLRSIDIPDSVTSIGGYAFAWCERLTSCTIGSGVTSIGSCAFENCSSLSSITINATTPPSLGGYVFNGTPYRMKIFVPCESYWIYKQEWSSYANNIYCNGEPPARPYKLSMTLNNSSVVNIDCSSSSAITTSDTNSYKSSVVSAVIGDCTTSIGLRAFDSCTSLTSCTISSGVTSIDNSAFQGCSRLSSIDIPNSVTSIGNLAFQSCGLISCTIGSGVTSIGDYAFRSCKSLTTIDIPNSVTTIGGEAFKGCSGLTSIDIPNSVTSLGGSAFSGCTSLTSCTIGSGSIGEQAFYRCTSLSSCTIGSGVTSIAYRAFEYCSGLTSISIPNSVTTIGGEAFSDCSGLTSCTIGSGVTTIGDMAFAYCSKLRRINIPNSVTSIGGGAFQDCTSLSSCTIGSGVTSINTFAFYECSGLTSISIPNSVTNIGDSAFAHCSGLTSCKIGSGMTDIGYFAFSNCSNLTSITVYAITPPTLHGNNVFDDTNNCPIYVPSESVDTYKSANYWRNHASRIQAIPNS